MKTWETEQTEQTYFKIGNRFYAGKAGSGYTYEDALREHSQRLEPCLNCGVPCSAEYDFICASCIKLSLFDGELA